jgi:cell division protease FtsH
MNRGIKTILLWLVVLVAAVLLWQVVRSGSEERNPEISYSRFLSEVEAGNIATVTIAGAEIQGLYRDGKGAFRLIGPSNPSLYLDQLREKGVEVRFRLANTDNLPLTLLGTWAPLVLLGALWFFMIRQMKQLGAKKQASSPQGAGSTGTSVNAAS